MAAKKLEHRPQDSAPPLSATSSAPSPITTPPPLSARPFDWAPTSSTPLFPFNYYGGTLSEKVLGKALKTFGVSRDEYVVSMKCGRYVEGFDFSAKRVTRSIDESLARLQLDYVDIMQCHDIEFGSLDQIVNETIPALQKLKEAGKIWFIGITGLLLM